MNVLSPPARYGNMGGAVLFFCTLDDLLGCNFWCPNPLFVGCELDASPRATHAEAASVTMQQQMQVTVPANVMPGQAFLVNMPGGQMQVTCPPNAGPGQAILVEQPMMQPPGQAMIVQQPMMQQPVAAAVMTPAAPVPMQMEQPMMGVALPGQPMMGGAMNVQPAMQPGYGAPAVQQRLNTTIRIDHTKPKEMDKFKTSVPVNLAPAGISVRHPAAQLARARPFAAAWYPALPSPPEGRVVRSNLFPRSIAIGSRSSMSWTATSRRISSTTMAASRFAAACTAATAAARRATPPARARDPAALPASLAAQDAWLTCACHRWCVRHCPRAVLLLLRPGRSSPVCALCPQPDQLRRLLHAARKLAEGVGREDHGHPAEVRPQVHLHQRRRRVLVGDCDLPERSAVK